MDQMANALVLLLALSIFSIVSFRKRLLDRDGILIAAIVGITIYLMGGLECFFLIVFFFVAAEIATKFGRSQSKNQHEERTTGNIIGNSAAAILALYFASPFGYYAAVSAALADTLSSEIGMLSKKKPRLVTTLKEVEHGTDGGITPLGCYAALFGAAMIGIFHFLKFQEPAIALVIILGGFFGSIADSVFGAAFELKKMLNNAQVNFLGSASGTTIAILLKSLLR
ncbi:MAG: DUF92 domain-containing protein [Candidatus Diapherotrites archaeon]|nr:DUF92 domain-containing protein [Candidatus Diapherotrites archaeon]